MPTHVRMTPDPALSGTCIVRMYADDALHTVAATTNYLTGEELALAFLGIQREGLGRAFLNALYRKESYEAWISSDDAYYLFRPFRK